MLQSLKQAGYRFTRFELPTDVQVPICLLRHDVDFDLDAAREMAQIEAELGVMSTYFFMVTTDHYNVFSAKSRQTIEEIVRLGHRIGLHFDEMAYPSLKTPSDYSASIGQESNFLAHAVRAPVDAVSLHRPSPLVLEGDPQISGSLLNSYDRRLRGVADYVSDSGGRWRHGHPLNRESFRMRSPLHILIHPVWWHESPITAFESLLRLLDIRRQRDEESFASNCRPFRVGQLSSDHSFASEV
jgi:hypothetical protein